MATHSDEENLSDSSTFSRISDHGARKRRKLESPPEESISRVKPKRYTVSRNINQAEIQESTEKRISFATLGVDPWLIVSLSNMQIKMPTRIQRETIPIILEGNRSVIGGSKTGSGKTCAFAVPLLHIWARDPSGIFALVLTPTR